MKATMLLCTNVVARCLSGEEEVSCEEVLAVTEGEDPR